MMVGTSSADTTARSNQYGPNRRASGKAAYSTATDSTAIIAGHRGSAAVVSTRSAFVGCDSAPNKQEYDGTKRTSSMKVIIRSSSLLFSLVGILLEIPLAKVRRKLKRAEPAPPASSQPTSTPPA